MPAHPLQKPRLFAGVAVALLLVALAAPCATPNRIVAAAALVLAIVAIGGIIGAGYAMLRTNRKEWEQDIHALARRSPNNKQV